MQTDVLIIGSGVAAAALALKILNNRPAASVLMLEAGDRVKLRDFALFQNYLITGKLPYSSRTDLDYPERDVTGENSTTDKDVILKGGRSMVYGGSTIHWGGWSFRMKPEDFKTRTLTGKGIDWAFDYEELEPFYGEAEHYIGVSGDSTDQITPRSRDYPYRAFPFTLEDILHIKSFEKLGYSYSHLPIARHGFTNTISSHAPCQTTGTCKYCPFGARYAASNYLDDLARDGDFPNFAVRLNMVAEEIIMSSKSQAGAVKVINKTGNAETVETIEAETIIIASGAIESPKLLQRSTSEFWAQGIGNDRDLVGRNFVTHPYFFYKAELKENSKQFQPEMGFPTNLRRRQIGRAS